MGVWAIFVAAWFLVKLGFNLGTDTTGGQKFASAMVDVLFVAPLAGRVAGLW